jgi:Na+-translocating ferredoxin:NAD+ oxidoreductase RnfE subunit
MPRYAGVAFIGGLYQVLGIVCGLGGIAVIVISLFAESDRSRSSAISSVVGVGGVVSGLGLVLIGFVIIGIGQLFDCVRDMARNSFQLHRR